MTVSIPGTIINYKYVLYRGRLDVGIDGQSAIIGMMPRRVSLLRFQCESTKQDLLTECCLCLRSRCTPPAIRRALR